MTEKKCGVDVKLNEFKSCGNNKVCKRFHDSEPIKIQVCKTYSDRQAMCKVQDGQIF